MKRVFKVAVAVTLVFLLALTGAAQVFAEGQNMLSIYALLTRAADTSDDGWIDRFVGMTYDDLLDTYDMAPIDAQKKAARYIFMPMFRIASFPSSRTI